MDLRCKFTEYRVANPIELIVISGELGVHLTQPTGTPGW